MNKLNLFLSSVILGSLCWETTVGQELFKLTVIDLVALVFSVLSGDLFVSLTVRFLNCFQGRLMDLEKLVRFVISSSISNFSPQFQCLLHFRMQAVPLSLANMETSACAFALSTRSLLLTETGTAYSLLSFL